MSRFLTKFLKKSFPAAATSSRALSSSSTPPSSNALTSSSPPPSSSAISSSSPPPSSSSPPPSPKCLEELAKTKNKKKKKKKRNQALEIMREREMFSDILGSGERFSESEEGNMEEDYVQEHHSRYETFGINIIHPNLASNFSLREPDVKISTQVTFTESLLGFERAVNYTAKSICLTCGGNGFAKGVRVCQCDGCKGKGIVKKKERPFTRLLECEDCHGKGKVPESGVGSSQCIDCGGAGQVEAIRAEMVHVNQAVTDGSICIFRGMGGRDGRQIGDLYLDVKVEPHDLFSTDGVNLYVNLVISQYEALQGGVFRVPTLTGEYSQIMIQPNTLSGHRIFLEKAAGFKYWDFSNAIPEARVGDMVVDVVIE